MTSRWQPGQTGKPDPCREGAAGGVELRVNGQPRRSGADPASRLVDVLRDEFGLTGTKIGCSAGDCGACTVQLDGEQVCACLVSLGRCAGADVRTVEGLKSVDGVLAPLQRAFVAHGAAQCGICTPGMLMAADATLRHHPAPTDQQILDGIGGVLCRCTGYRKIVDAIRSLSGGGLAPAEPAGVPAHAIQTGAAVGARVDRLDASAKIDGSARFGADAMPADGLYLRVVRSPAPSCDFEFDRLDDWIATRPGVVGYLLPADIPNNRFAIFPDLRDQPALAEGFTRFRGEAVLAIVGERAAIAALDTTQVPVHWAPQADAQEPEQALAVGAPVVNERWPDNVLCRGRLLSGDPDQAFARASRRFDAEMRTAYVEHAYIEPEAGWAVWDAVRDEPESGDAPRVTIFATTQTPYMDRDEIAWMFGIAPERVRIIPSAVGGGFGGKLDLSIQPLLVAAARKFGRPACIIYERRESMLSSTKRHPARMRASLALDADGSLAAYAFDGDFNTGAYSSWGPTVANRVPIHASGPYRFGAVSATTRAVLTNNAIAGAFRGFGVPQSTLLNEWLIDEAAAVVGDDPLEFRHRHALRAGDRTPCGQMLGASVGLRACLDALRPAWRQARARCEAFNAHVGRSPRVATDLADPHLRGAAAKRRGVGVACMWYGIGNTVIANPSSMTIGLSSNGRFTLYNGAIDIGQGTGTIMAQIAADALGVPLSSIDQTAADTALTRDAGKSSASRQTFVSGNAARLAGEDLKRRLLQLLGLDHRGSIAIVEGALVGRFEEQCVSRPLHQLPRDALGHVAMGQGEFNPPTVPLDADGQGVPYATYGFAAQFAEVEVDGELGTVRVLAIHAAHDVGKAVNPLQVEGQIHGGIAQGLGLALHEEYRSGLTDNLHDYLIPTAGDIPPITVHLIEDPEPLGPYGAKGVGEPALVATAPAILNAIHHATGVRIDRVPVTPDRLHAMLGGHGGTPTGGGS